MQSSARVMGRVRGWGSGAGRALALWGLVGALAMLVAGCAGVPAGAERAPRCPQGRDDSAMFCAEVVRWGRDPDSGQCCRYGSICSAPAGWKTYPTRSACEAQGARD